MILETEIISFAKNKIPGGIHPPEYKSMSNQRAIQWLPPSKELILPLPKQSNEHQHLLVSVKDHVSAGQNLLSADIPGSSTNTHSPCDGEILEVAKLNLGHPSGLPAPAIRIKQRLNRCIASLPPFDNWLQAEPALLVERIQEAGIVGMGGAAFPTHIKLESGSNPIKTLIVNAMECEPYITCDDRLLREHSHEVLQGALITAKIVGASNVLFGIEDNKPEAIAALAHEIGFHRLQDVDAEVSITNYSGQENMAHDVDIIVAKTMYPSGGEKQLIQLLTGLEVPQNEYPSALGILVQNVATLYAINDAVCKGQTLTHRLVTLTGDLVDQPGNYWVAFGTPVSHLISALAIDIMQVSKVIFGGPLMGQMIFDLETPTRKSTNCIIFNAENEALAKSKSATFHAECIRCGECEKVCPASLLPQQLYWFSKSEQWQQSEQHNLFDCIECGACSYVCPSEIPLVNYYRFAKSEIKHLKVKQKKSELAKLRFENRENRLVRIKTEREEKRRKTAEARKLAAANKNKDPEGKKSAIEAALQRVKNKKEEPS